MATKRWSGRYRFICRDDPSHVAFLSNLAFKRGGARCLICGAMLDVDPKTAAAKAKRWERSRDLVARTVARARGEEYREGGRLPRELRPEIDGSTG